MLTFDPPRHTSSIQSPATNMPTLKQVTCSIDLGSSNIKLKEYGHRYRDGTVETFIAVPDSPMPFSVHVTSEGYIAPGLSAFVYIDGIYHTNRNRLDLQMPNPGVPKEAYEIDFRLRQKEEKTDGKTFVTRDWVFTALDTSESPLL